MHLCQFAATVTRCAQVPCIAEAVLAEKYRRREVADVAAREKAAARAVATLRMELRDERDDHEQARLFL